MDFREREELDLVVELAKNRQPQAAHFIASRLLEKYPDDCRAQVLAALTSPGPVEARTVFEAAKRLDPADPILALAIEWLEKRPAGPSAPANRPLNHTFNQPVSGFRGGPTQTLERPVSRIAPAYKSPGLTAVAVAPPTETTPPSPDVPETADKSNTLQDEPAGQLEPSGKKAAKVKLKPGNRAPKPKAVVKPLSVLWWLRLGCSLLFFGATLGIIYILVTANNLNETEKAYAESISQLTQKTDTINARLQIAISEFNAGQLDRAGLEKELQEVTGLNAELLQLKSPSPRFDKLDGFLGEAYSYFNDGATNLIKGLESGSADDFNEGYHLFNMGNDALRQARDELKALGG